MVAVSTPEETHTARKSVIKDYARILVVSAVLALFIRTFVVQAFQIPSGSMENTLLVGDFLLANKFLYGAKIPLTGVRLPAVRHPRRGDVIIFRDPREEKDLIKRCVAVAGDKVELRENTLLVNGEEKVENYVALRGPAPALANFGPLTVPEGCLFMLGDNRNNSLDSRFWGPLDEKLVKGSAMVLYLSWDKEKGRPRLSRIGDVIR
jgi:signal peptidase I